MDVVWLQLVHVVIVPVSSCTHLSCYIWKTQFHCSHLLPLPPTVFLPPLPQWSLSLGKRICDIEIPLEKSLFNWIEWQGAMIRVILHKRSQSGWFPPDLFEHVSFSCSSNLSTGLQSDLPHITDGCSSSSFSLFYSSIQRLRKRSALKIEEAFSNNPLSKFPLCFICRRIYIIYTCSTQSSAKGARTLRPKDKHALLTYMEKSEYWKRVEVLSPPPSRGNNSEITTLR